MQAIVSRKVPRADYAEIRARDDRQGLLPAPLNKVYAFTIALQVRTGGACTCTRRVYEGLRMSTKAGQTGLGAEVMWY